MFFGVCVATTVVAVSDGEGGVACDAFVVLAPTASAAERVFESDTILLASLGAESALCAPSDMVGGDVVDAIVLHCKMFKSGKLVFSSVDALGLLSLELLMGKIRDTN